jgi:hypothetical protein
MTIVNRRMNTKGVNFQPGEKGVNFRPPLTMSSAAALIGLLREAAGGWLSVFPGSRSLPVRHPPSHQEQHG